jgi:hypothetical protein
MQQAIAVSTQTLLDADTIEDMFTNLQFISQWPVASQMSADTITAVLHLAIEAGSPACCETWLMLLPAYEQIDTEQLMGLLRAVLGSLAQSGRCAIPLLADAPAFKQLTTAQAASLMTAAVEAAAATRAAAGQGRRLFAAITANKAPTDLGSLCIRFMQADTLAGRDKAAVIQWLLPAVTAALSAGMPVEACNMVAFTKGAQTKSCCCCRRRCQRTRMICCFSYMFEAVPAAQNIGANQLLQLLQTCTAGNSSLGMSAKRAIMHSKG